jgi:sulfate adenylyltransferase subunit 1 (EFTu-like GTPase family)
MVLPSGRETRVRSIVTPEGELAEAFAPMSVTVCLDEELDVSRGDMLVAPADPPARARRFEATLVWMNEKPAAADRPYLLKHTTQTLPARIVEIRHRVDIHTLAAQPAGELRLNEIGAVLVETQRPLFVDPYRRNRFTGSFILLDALTNETLGAGMIESAVAETGGGRVPRRYSSKALPMCCGCWRGGWWKAAIGWWCFPARACKWDRPAYCHP